MPDPAASFAGKTVLITGASSGIGHAFAHRLAAVGAELILVARRAATLVVNTTLRTLIRRRPSVVDGRANTLVAALAPRLPERLTLSLAERSVRPVAASREAREVLEASARQTRR